MIYTVTFNPSLDYTVSMNGFELGKTNRTIGEQMFPGGKGMNVSIVLSNLGLRIQRLVLRLVLPENRLSGKCAKWGCLPILSILKRVFPALM